MIACKNNERATFLMHVNNKIKIHLSGITGWRSRIKNIPCNICNFSSEISSESFSQTHSFSTITNTYIHYTKTKLPTASDLIYAPNEYEPKFSQTPLEILTIKPHIKKENKLSSTAPEIFRPQKITIYPPIIPHS